MTLTLWGRQVEETERQYETQAEAVAAERQRLWGITTVRGCDYKPLNEVPPVQVWVRNNQFVLVFDNFGRVFHKSLLNN